MGRNASRIADKARTVHFLGPLGPTGPLRFPMRTPRSVVKADSGTSAGLGFTAPPMSPNRSTKLAGRARTPACVASATGPISTSVPRCPVGRKSVRSGRLGVPAADGSDRSTLRRAVPWRQPSSSVSPARLKVAPEPGRGPCRARLRCGGRMFTVLRDEVVEDVSDWGRQRQKLTRFAAEKR